MLLALCTLGTVLFAIVAISFALGFAWGLLKIFINSVRA